MSNNAGQAVRTQRNLRGWTQEQLAERARLGVRTLQRLETGEVAGSAETLTAVADALGVDVSALLLGLSLDDIRDVITACTCSVCGAPLEARLPVPHEHGDGEVEVFTCGAMRGDQYRPCSDDPSFPTFDDYDLMVWTESDERVWCAASGRTPAASAVPLAHGVGHSEAEARRQVEWNYLSTRHDAETADKLVGTRW